MRKIYAAMAVAMLIASMFSSAALAKGGNGVHGTGTNSGNQGDYNGCGVPAYDWSDSHCGPNTPSERG